MMASPMYLSRVPPRRKICSVITSKERLRIEASCSGSIPSASGIPGQKDRPHSRKFVLDFKGGRFEHLPWETKVEPLITVSRGQILTPAVRPVVGGDTWRCNFDLLVDGKDPVDMRLYLKDAKGALTETWLYQYTP